MNEDINMTNEENNIDFEEINEITIEDVSEDSINEEQFKPLNLGSELTLKDLYPISCTESSKFLVLAGSNGCGKTTLITAIYQQFLTKQFNRYYFAGSLTLQAFEERAFYNRIQSQQSSPNMKRTATGSLDSILHLRLLDSTTNIIKNILLTDFSGEDFNRVSGDCELAKEEFSMLYQTRMFLLILDGEKILSKRNRNKELQKSIQLFRTFLDAGVLNPKAQVIVVLSKYDLIVENLEIDTSLNVFINSILPKISNIPSFDSYIKLCKVAAMPERKNHISQGFGIVELLDDFFEKENNINHVVDYKSQSQSQFSLFGERVKR